MTEHLTIDGVSVQRKPGLHFQALRRTAQSGSWRYRYRSHQCHGSRVSAGLVTRLVSFKLSAVFGAALSLCNVSQNTLFRSPNFKHGSV